MRFDSRHVAVVLLVLLLLLMIAMIAPQIFADESRRFIARILGVDAAGAVWMEPVLKPKLFFWREEGQLPLSHPSLGRAGKMNVERDSESLRGTVVNCAFATEKRRAVERGVEFIYPTIVLRCDDGSRYALAGIDLD